MKFKNYLKAINQLAEDNPECLEFDVTYGEDDEGNLYGLVSYEPSIGYYEDGTYETELDNPNDEPFNAVCVN